MKWEYKKLLVTFNHQDLEKVLNELGNDKWELVGLAPTNTNFDGRCPLLFVFKREKQKKRVAMGEPMPEMM